jgi:predicted permease
MWLFKTPLKIAALQGTSGSYGNVGYMGLPLSVAFFGPEAAVPAALVFCFDCTVQFVLTAFLATLAHERNEEAHWGAVAWRIVKQVATHPFIVATALGVAASALQFTAPGALGTILEMLMRSAGPTALFALGVTVGMRRFAGIGRELPLVAGMKVFVQPALALLVVGMVPGIDPTWLHVAVMMAALPTASNAFILASQYRAYVEGSSTAVIVTTALSAITIPAIIYFIKTGILP